MLTEAITAVDHFRYLKRDGYDTNTRGHSAGVAAA